MSVNLKDCDIEFYRAGGPGGQHRNKVSTAVRITHRPTGIRAQATERRSQAQNKSLAFARLCALIAESMHVPEERIATVPSDDAISRRLDNKAKASKKKSDRRWRMEE